MSDEERLAAIRGREADVGNPPNDVAFLLRLLDEARAALKGEAIARELGRADMEEERNSWRRTAEKLTAERDAERQRADLLQAELDAKLTAAATIADEIDDEVLALETRADRLEAALRPLLKEMELLLHRHVGNARDIDGQDMHPLQGSLSTGLVEHWRDISAAARAAFAHPGKGGAAGMSRVRDDVVKAWQTTRATVLATDEALADAACAVFHRELRRCVALDEDGDVSSCNYSAIGRLLASLETKGRQ